MRATTSTAGIRTGIDAEDMEIGELHDSRHWLDGWTRQDGSQPPFGELSLLPEELLPRGALDDADPDEQWLHEATGNAGVSLERAYRLAALVLWPRSETPGHCQGRGGINGAVAWVAGELDRNDGVADERIRAAHVGADRHVAVRRTRPQRAGRPAPGCSDSCPRPGTRAARCGS